MADQILNIDDFFSKEGGEGYLNILEAVKEIDSVYDSFSKSVKKSSIEIDKAIKKQSKTMIDYSESLKKAQETEEKGRKIIKESVEITEKSFKETQALAKAKKELEAIEKKLNSIQDKRKKTSESLNNIDEEAIRLEAKLGKSTGDRAKEHAELRIQIQEQTKATKEAAKESLGLVSLYQKESKRLGELRDRYKDVALTQGLASAEAKELQKEVQALDEKLKSVDGKAGQFQRNVGNYPELFQSVGGAMGQAATGVNTLGTSLKALIANPVGLVIAAIVGAVVLLFNGFKKLTGGAEILEKVVAGLSITFGTLVGRIGKLISGEISFSEFLTETDDAIIDQIKASNQLITIRRQLEKQTADTELAEAKYGETLAKLSVIRDNDTKSLSQREQAANLYIQTIRKQNATLLDLANKELKAAELAVKTTEEGTEDRRLAEIEYTKALAAQVNARTEAYSEEQDAIKELQMIQLDRFEQELDLLIDIDDRRKSVNERTIADERTVFSERERLLRENLNLSEDTFNKQIATYEKYFGVQLDGNYLLKLSGQELFDYTAKLGLSERAVNRLREVIIEKQAADRDNLDTIRDVNNALALQTVSDQAFTKIQEDNSIKRVKNAKDSQKDLLKGWKDYYKTIEDAARKTYENSAEYIRDSAIKGITALQEAVNSTASLLSDGLNAITDIQVGNDQRRINSLEEQKNRELAVVGDNAEARANIEKRYDERIKRLEIQQQERKRKIAVFDKALAITNSIIATAKAVVEALPNIPLSVAIGIIGGLKTAAIASQPIPQFEKGTSYSPEGLAIVDEKGAELIQKPDGSFEMGSNKGARFTQLDKGSKIYTADQTSRIMKDAAINSENSMLVKAFKEGQVIQERPINEAKLAKEIAKNIGRKFDNSVKKIPSSSINVNEKGIQRLVKKAMMTTKYK